MQKMPIGIRNNNPGNLRQNVGLSYPTITEDGFAKMHSIQDGAQAMLSLLWQYYDAHHYTTLFEIITHYAPATENDVTAYITNVCRLANLNPLKAKTYDLGLDHFWNMLDLARAMTIVENGRPDQGWHCYPDWVSVGEWVIAGNRCQKWIDI